jgi:hypothetical protein
MANFPVSIKLPSACAAVCRAAGPSTCRRKRKKMAVVFLKRWLFYAHVLKSVSLPEEQKTKMADFPVSTVTARRMRSSMPRSRFLSEKQKQNGSYLSKYVGFFSLQSLRQKSPEVES